MITDNADDTEVFFGSSNAATQRPEGRDRPASEGDLGRFIPECPHGAVLVTTRNKQTGFKLARGRGMIEVGPMDQEESCQLISKRLEDDNLDTKQITLLTALLENLPLALVQAAAFIQQNSLTVTKYIQLLEEGDHSLIELLSQPFEEEGRDSSVPNAVTATWSVSFKQIDKQYPHASDLLSLMSFFDRQRIPRLFVAYNEEQEDGEEGYQQEQPGRPRGAIELEKALGVLKAFSFVSESEVEGSLNMHRLTQLVMRKWLITKGKAARWGSIALCKLSALFPHGQYENWTLCVTYLPHVYTVLTHKSSAAKKEATAEAT